MDALAAAMITLAAQIAANYHAFMGIQHIDAVLFMLAGSALVSVVPYATGKYSGTIDTPPLVPLDDILSNVELSVPLPIAPNVPAPSIWGHPNTVQHTPSEPRNQALALRTSLPPIQATPWVSLGLTVIGIFIISALTWLVHRCCRGSRHNVAAAAAADDDIPTEDQQSINSTFERYHCKNQAEQQDRVKELQRRLDDLNRAKTEEVNRMTNEAFDLRQQLDVTNQKLSGCEASRTALQQQGYDAEDHTKRLQQRIEELEKELATKKQTLEEYGNTKLKQQVGNFQYVKALEQQVADLKLQLEELTAARTNAPTTESASGKALEDEFADLEHELEQRDRTILDLEKEVSILQKRAQDTGGQATNEDSRTRLELTSQVEGQNHTIEKLAEQIKELEGRFLVAEVQASVEDLQRRHLEDSRTICTQKAENKKLKAQLQHAIAEYEGRVPSAPASPWTSTPVAPHSLVSTVGTSNASINASTSPQQKRPHAALTHPIATISTEMPNNTLKNEERLVIDTSLTRTPGPTTGEDQRAALIELSNTAPKDDEVDDDDVNGEEDSSSDSADSSYDFYLGDQSAEADAIERTIRSASGGESDAVGHINNGTIPVYATEVNQYVNNPIYGFKWVRGKEPKKEIESDETEGKETGNEINEQTVQKAEETELKAQDRVIFSTELESPSTSESILLHAELETVAPQKGAESSRTTDKSPAPDQGLTSSSQSKTGDGNDASDPLKLNSEFDTVPATTPDTNRGISSQQKSSNPDGLKTNRKTAGEAASTSSQSAVTPAPLNRDLNTSELPLRSSPEVPLPRRQAVGGNRPAGPKLDLTKNSVQRDIASALNTPPIVRNNPKVSPSLAGSRFAPGSPHQPVKSPGPKTPLAINSSTSSRRASPSTPRLPRRTSSRRQLGAGTPNAPPNALTGPTGKNTCRLCGATFRDTTIPKWSFTRDHLPKCRAWKTEWGPQKYAKKNGDPNFPPQWKRELTQRPALDPDWLVTAKKVQSERDNKMKRVFFANGTPKAAATVTTDQPSNPEAGDQSEGAVEKSITKEKGEIVERTASGRTTKNQASDGDLEDVPTTLRSKKQTVPSPGGTKSYDPQRPKSPFKWDDDEDEGGAVYRMPSWAPEPRGAGHEPETVRTNDSKQEQGDRSVPNNKSEQGKASKKQAGRSSAHDAKAPPTPSPKSALTPSRGPDPASATLATSATASPVRNQVLVDVHLSTPPFVPNSGQLSGGGIGGSRWASPTEGSSTPSSGALSPNPQTSTSGRGSRQSQNKGKSSGRYRGGKKQ